MAWIRRSVFGVPIYRWLALASIGLALFTASFLIRGQLNIEWSVESLRAFVLGLGLWGPLAFIGILSFRFLFLIPSGILLVGAGILFGPIFGMLYAGLGLFLSGMVKYLFAAVIGRDTILRQLPLRLQLWVSDIATRKMSAWALAGVCAYPFVPKHIFQIAAIISGMHLPAYILSVLAGCFVRAAIFANLGEAIYNGSGLITATALLIALLILPAIVPPWRRWILAPLSTRSKPLPTEETNL